MPVADETVKIIFDGDSKGATGAAEQTSAGIEGMASTITTVLGGAAIVGAFAAVGKGIMDLATLADQEQRGIILLGQAVKNTGADWDVASAAIETYLTKELARTALDDGPGRAAIQKLTETTGDYKVALDLMALTQDLAASTGMDLTAAAQIVGRVHEGNTGILSRYGIVVEEGTSATDALKLMSDKFSGSAEALGHTMGGATERMSIGWGNIKETIGAALLQAVQPIMEKLAELAQAVLPIVEQALAKLQPVFNWLMDEGKPIMLALAVAVGTVLVAAFVAMGAAAWAAATPVIAAVSAILVPLLPFIAIVAGIALLVVLVKKAWTDNWGGMQEKTKAVFDWFKEAWSVVQTWLEDTIANIPEAFAKVGTAIKDVFTGAWDWLVGLWGGIGDWLHNLFSNIHIPLPHFHVNWTEVLGIRIPSGVGVDWYGSGLDRVFTQPTLIGVGESGAERVQVTPTGARGGGGSGDTWNINIVTPDNQVGRLQNLLTMLQMARS